MGGKINEFFDAQISQTLASLVRYLPSRSHVPPPRFDLSCSFFSKGREDDAGRLKVRDPRPTVLLLLRRPEDVDEL